MIKNGRRAVWVAVFAIWGCGRAQSGAPEPFQGVVEFEETLLSFEVSGRLTQLLVDEGDEVQANATLGTLDDTVVRTEREAEQREAAAARSEVELLRAGAKRDDIQALEARVRAARATEARLEKNLARERALYANQVVAEASVDDLEAETARARAEREGLESQLASLKLGARRQEVQGAGERAGAREAALRVTDERLEHYTLRAPQSGRILDRHVEEGEVVGAGIPILTLGDTKHPFADVFIPQGELTGIRVGSPASLRVDGEARTFPGKVERIARRTEFTPRYLFSERERKNLVIRVRVRVDDPEERLHAGVPAFVTIAAGANTPSSQGAVLGDNAPNPNSPETQR